MSLNFNDAPQQRTSELIPDGTFVKMTMTIRPGSDDLPGCEPMDKGLFKAARPPSDYLMLDLEFTISEPAAFAHRKIWENWGVAGGSVDEKGISKGWNMTKQRIRAALESCTGTDPKDEGPQAKANRMVQGFRQLDNLWFFAKIKVEAGQEIEGKPGQHYDDKNMLDYIVVPGMAEYAALAAGQPVAAKPRNARTVSAAPGQTQTGSAGKPAWERKDEPALPGTTTQQEPATAAAVTGAAPAQGPAWLR